MSIAELFSWQNALVVLVAGAIASFLNQAISSLWGLFVSRTTCSMTFTSENETYQWIVDWLAEHPSMKKSLNLLVSVKRTTNNTVSNSTSSIWLPENLPSVHYLPGEGNHVFFHNGIPIWVTCTKKEKEPSRRYWNVVSMREITLSIAGNDRRFLESIVDEAMEKFYSKTKNKVTVYINEDYSSDWLMGLLKTPRPLSSVILDDGISEKIVSDVTKFIESKDWYEKHGIPYRRGYLLYGPPGTGKTSFIVALAGHLNKSICVVSLKSRDLSSSKLNILFNTAPIGSILLMEDVDAAFVSTKTEQDDSKVTPSDILNTLDGISSQEGNIVFMTTNHIEVLADSLIRPGRIDMKILFERASKNQTRKIFRYFFPELSKSQHEEEFVDKIPEKSFSSAELQNLFIQYRDDPEELLENLESSLEMIKKIRNEK